MSAPISNMRYPPLNALKAFEAAARNGSFLLAAKELHVSAASVSRFIKILESDLGCTLFMRHPSGVHLTDIGEKYWAATRPSLQAIASISQEYREQEHRRTLQIVSIPAIAETWLVSHLWSFQQRHRDIEINLVLSDKPVDLYQNDTTIWLAYSNENIAGTESFAMSKNSMMLVCNPEIGMSLKRIKDILNYPILVDTDWHSDWDAWLLEANLQTKINNQIDFERYSMVINAAIAGTGVAIGHTALLQTYLSQGSLVTPFEIAVKTDKQFCALVAENPKRGAVRHFINWFTGQTVFNT